MSLRRLCNVAYASLCEPLETQQQLDALDRRLAAPFDYELTPEQRKMEEAHRWHEERTPEQRGDGMLQQMRARGMMVGPSGQGAR